MSPVTARPARKAPRGSSQVMLLPASTMTPTAPAEAPPLTPMIPGSASGLLNRLCSAAPEIASAAPDLYAHENTGDAQLPHDRDVTLAELATVDETQLSTHDAGHLSEGDAQGPDRGRDRHEQREDDESDEHAAQQRQAPHIVASFGLAAGCLGRLPAAGLGGAVGLVGAVGRLSGGRGAVHLVRSCGAVCRVRACLVRGLRTVTGASRQPLRVLARRRRARGWSTSAEHRA